MFGRGFYLLFFELLTRRISDVKLLAVAIINELLHVEEFLWETSKLTVL